MDLRPLSLAFALACALGAADPASPNLIANSEDLTSSAWAGFAVKTTITASTVADPDGKQGAFQVKIDGGFVGQIITGAKPGSTYLFSAWCRTTDGADLNETIAWENNPPGQFAQFTPVAISGAWKRICLAATCPAAGNVNFRVSFRNGDILVWHPQVEELASKDVTEPGAYVPTGGKSIPPAPHVTTPADASKDIACWGDSLTQGAGGKPYPAVLGEALAGRTVFNGGVGGERSPQIKARFLAAPARFGDITVIWAGRNNFGEVDVVEADIAEMVGKLTTDRYLVLGVLNMASEPRNATIIRLNQDLEKRYTTRFLDIRRILVDAYDAKSEGDVADHAADVPPRSLRSDGIHLNDAGYRLVAERVQEAIKSQGWLSAAK